MQVFVIINTWNNNKFPCECKELINKGICDKGFIWNPSNCECECDKTCDIGEYNENIEETSLVRINSTKCKHNSCILYIVLFLIFFTMNIGKDVYFVALGDVKVSIKMSNLKPLHECWIVFFFYQGFLHRH